MEQTRRSTMKGTLFVLAAAILWSTNGLFIKWLSLPPMLIVGLRSLIAGLALLPFVRIKSIPWNRYLIWMIASYCLHCLLMVLSFRHTSAPIASGGQFAAPLWLFLLARLQKHSWKKRELLPLGCLLAGLIVFMFSSGEGSTLQGNIYAAVSSFSFAALTYSSARVSGENPLGVTSISSLFTAAVMFLFFIPDKSVLFTIERVQWGVLLYLGIFQLGLGYASYYTGMRHISAQRAAMISSMELIASPIWVMLFLKETSDLFSFIGFFLIVAGVVLSALQERFRLQELGQTS